jgi:hypothetical protein
MSKAYPASRQVTSLHNSTKLKKEKIHSTLKKKKILGRNMCTTVNSLAAVKKVGNRKLQAH